MAAVQHSAAPRGRALARRLAPAVALLAIAAAAWAAGLPEQLTLGNLGRHEAALRAAVAQAPLLAVAVYVAAFALLTAAGLPVALALSLAGGALFGPWVGGAATALAATGGAALAYAAARSALAAWLKRRGGRVAQAARSFGENAFGYILLLRVLPLMPFGVVNLAAGVAAAPFRAFLLATIVGAIPTSLIYANLGAGLGRTLHARQPSPADLVHDPQVLASLAALAALAISSLLARRLRQGRG